MYQNANSERELLEEIQQIKQLLRLMILQLNNKISDSPSTSKKDSRQRGVQATEKGLAKMRAAKASRLGDGHRLTNERLAEAAVLSPKTVQRFLTGKNVDPASAIAILDVLNLNSQDILEDRNSHFISGI